MKNIDFDEIIIKAEKSMKRVNTLKIFKKYEKEFSIKYVYIFLINSFF